MPGYAAATSAVRSTRTARCSRSTIRCPPISRPRPRADAVPGQRRFPPRAFTPSRSEAIEHLLSSAQRRGQRRRRAHEQLSRSPAGDDRPPQLRRQDQLEPHGRAPDLGRSQPHGLAHRRSARASVCRTSDGDGGTEVWQYTAGQTWTLGPTLTMDGTIGLATMYTTREDRRTTSRACSAWSSSAFRAPTIRAAATSGTPGLPKFNTGFRRSAMPSASFPIPATIGRVSGGFNVTKFAGQHEFKGGYTFSHMTLEHWNPEGANPRGSFTSRRTRRGRSAPARRPRTSTTSTRRSCSDWSAPRTRASSTGCSPSSEWQHAAYFRDRWNVNPKLTLDLGFRWEYYPIMSRAIRQGIERLDLDTLEVLLGGVGGNPHERRAGCGEG